MLDRADHRFGKLDIAERVRPDHLTRWPTGRIEARPQHARLEMGQPHADRAGDQLGPDEDVAVEQRIEHRQPWLGERVDARDQRDRLAQPTLVLERAQLGAKLRGLDGSATGVEHDDPLAVLRRDRRRERAPAYSFGAVDADHDVVAILERAIEQRRARRGVREIGADRRLEVRATASQRGVELVGAAQKLQRAGGHAPRREGSRDRRVRDQLDDADPNQRMVGIELQVQRFVARHPHDQREQPRRHTRARLAADERRRRDREQRIQLERDRREQTELVHRS